MNKSLWVIVVLVLIIIVGGAVWYMQSKAPASMSADMQGMDMSDASTTVPANLGTYPYECDEHVTFTMTPSGDMSSIVIAPLNNSAFPATTTLMVASSTSGVRYEGNGTVFTGLGEGVTLTSNGSTLNCSPVSNPDLAPFNFGQ